MVHMGSKIDPFVPANAIRVAGNLQFRADLPSIVIPAKAGIH
jgi:hypothetical protein